MSTTDEIIAENADRNRAYFGRRTGLAERLRVHSVAVTQRGFRAFDMHGCLYVADALLAVETRKQRPNEHDPDYAAAAQAAREYRTTLAVLKAKASPENWIWQQRLENEISAIDAMLPGLAAGGDRDEIRFIDEAARAAWGSANDGRAPRSPEKNAPRAKFIALALGEIGIAITPAGISSVLTGRRRPT